MKNYFKILFITMMIQLSCFLIGALFNNMPAASTALSDVGVWVFLAGFMIAIIVDIVLAIRWGKDVKQKLIYIFLMPTNYVGVILAGVFFWYIGQVLHLLFGV